MSGFKYKSTIFAVILAAFMSLALAASSGAIMLVSKADEIKIGKETEERAIKQYGGLANDQAMTDRVARVGASVAAVSTRKDITYTYKVLNSDIVNAFACPGGPVLITKKLVNMLNTDDELAFVLAHETGHIAAQHGRKAINNAILAAGIAAILFRNANDTMQTGLSIVYTLWDRGYSRDQEHEADRLGGEFMTKANYNGEGAIKALAKLGMKKSDELSKYFSTHPDTPDRVDRVAKQLNITPERKDELIKSVQAADAKNGK